MKKYNKLLITLAVLLIAAGAFVYAIGLSMGGSRNLVISKDGRVITNGGEYTGVFNMLFFSVGFQSERNSNTVYFDNPYGVPDWYFFELVDKTRVHSIEMEIAVGNVTIKSGEDFSVEGKYINEEWLDMFITNGKLFIYEKPPMGVYFTGESRIEYIVTLPENYRLDTVIVLTAAGKINAENIRAENIKIESASGGVTAARLEADNIKIGCASGDAEVKTLTGHTTINCSSGGIRAADINGNLTVSAAMGYIEINGTILGNIDATAATGTITFNLENDPGDFAYDIKSMNKVLVNGVNIKESDLTDFNRKSAEYMLKVSAATGNVALNFRD